MIGPLHFRPIFMERVWGGTKLGPFMQTEINAEGPVGEAWLVSDHASAESIIDAGPHAGRTLRHLLEADAESILGRLPELTPHGRFPLLLKILDSGAPLSVQVHPDDECAARLGEPDIGKTEMWHVIESDLGGELICGLDPALDATSFRNAAERGEIEAAMVRFKAVSGDSVLVTAGTVHAIGAGVLLAEIQQNSDLTYRVYDYKRLGPEGKPRELHLDKAAKAARFGSVHAGKNAPLELAATGAKRTILAACSYFAAERIEIVERYRRETRGDSFHIVLTIEGTLRVAAGQSDVGLPRGHAALVPAAEPAYELSGEGTALVYYVPDLVKDVVEPLLRAGHTKEQIIRLGGAPAESSLAGLI